MQSNDSPLYAADDARWSALMASAQAGHEADYRVLLAEMSQVITRYLLSRIGSQHFVDDCVQETLIAIHQARHTYDPHRSFRAWLFAIVRHKAIDALRKQKVQQSTAQRYHADSDALSPVGHVENDAMSGRLIDSLSVQHREAITLTKLLGLSTTEAAAQLSISESALKVRVHRATNKLRQLMEADAL
jgi:RNA polymerase sigma-70 factor (ECF subfamily)